MSNIYKTIYDALSSLGYPVREQGTYAADEVLPVTMITYQLIDEPDSAHYENLPFGKITRFQIAFYAKDPSKKQSADGLLRSVMIPAGFLRASGRDLPFNSDTGHYGYISDYRFYETEG